MSVIFRLTFQHLPSALAGSPKVALLPLLEKPFIHSCGQDMKLGFGSLSISASKVVLPLGAYLHPYEVDKEEAHS